MSHRLHPHLHLATAWPLAWALLAGAPVPAMAATPAELAAGYATQATTPPRPTEGQRLFTSRHGGQWRCASCHGDVPTQPGRHAVTGKPIGALAPAFNPERFSDAQKTEKWFRRNCKDVLGRECTPAEKADVLAWLMSLKP
jgi:hypothetical protein